MPRPAPRVEAGVAPATLVQRFGSKRGLLLAVVQQRLATVGQEFAEIRAAHPSPLEALWAVGTCMARFVETPEAMSNHLAFFQMDLTDPDFYRLTLEHARIVRSEIRALLDAAIEAGELAPCDAARLARAIQVTLNGSLLTWAVFREGTVGDWIREDLETLLYPFRVSHQRPSPPRQSTAAKTGRKKTARKR